MEKLFIVWSGVSKNGNTSVILSNSAPQERERKEVKFNGKKYKQIILEGMDEDATPKSNKDRKSYLIMLEGDHAADFVQGEEVMAKLTAELISKSDKGSLFQALLSTK